MSKSCWSISWDHQYRVYAVYLRMTFGGDLELLSCCCDTSGQRTLGDRLTSILEKIQVGEERLSGAWRLYAGVRDCRALFSAPGGT